MKDIDPVFPLVISFLFLVQIWLLRHHLVQGILELNPEIGQFF